jgi:FtsP/CotA-like multicopper oxidase with cupredoxin domain
MSKRPPVQSMGEVSMMKRFWIGLVMVLLVLGSVGYVYADRLTGVHNLQITDSNITPAQIIVKENDVVKIKVTNKGTKKHNLVIPDYYIFTQNLNIGETTDAEFTANQKGQFPYYSDTPGSPEPGIKGMLIVK